LGRVSMPLSRVSRLKVGDVIPIDSPQSVAVLIEDLELLHGTFGAHEGQLAVRIGGQSGSPSRRF
ncbi:FliM/FliN family flagellar motor C-terminal domain-containing protein, partial [Acinetobacter baumannii]